MRRAAKLDQNQPDIVRALRRIPGVVVQSLAPVGEGVPDLLVGLRNHRGERINLLLEVKVPNGPKAARRWVLTPDQELWHQLWTGQVCVVCTVDEALDVVLAAQVGERRPPHRKEPPCPA